MHFITPYPLNNFLGASLIAIHARYRVNLVGRSGAGARDGAAMLDQVRDIKRALVAAGDNVTIIANGNVISHEDVEQNLLFTGADGIMSAEGLLDNPTLFQKGSKPLTEEDQINIALEYLQLVHRYPATVKTTIFHTRRICGAVLTRFQLLDDCLHAKSASEVERILQQAQVYLREGGFTFDHLKEKKAKDALMKRKVWLLWWTLSLYCR